MREPRQANCSFITYFLGQTRSAAFSLKNKRRKKNSKDNKKVFSFLYTAEMLSQLRAAPQMMHTPCPQAPCHGTAMALAVHPQGLCVACPQGWALACPRRPWYHSLCCVCPFCSCLGPFTPGMREGPLRSSALCAERDIQAAPCWLGISARGTM